MFTSDEVFISHSDSEVVANCVSAADGRPKPCTVKIGVFGTLASDYSITLTTHSSATTLLLGQVGRGTVRAQSDNFYRVRLAKSLSAHALPYSLRFATSLSSGHASLYVSCLSTTPGPLNSMWSVSPIDSLSGSVIEIDSVSAQEKGCHRACMTGSIDYYATVHGDSAAVYTITASLANDSSLQLLVPGHSSVGTVLQNNLNYYYLRLSTDQGSSGAVKQAEQDMTLTLSILQGYADVYVSLSFTNRPTFNFTTRTVDHYVLTTKSDSTSSFVMLMTKTIPLNHDRIQDLCRQETTEDCYLVIGVLGTRVTSTRYTLEANFQDATKLLSNGVPVLGSVGKSRMEFYKYVVTQDGLDVVVAITPFSGDPGKKQCINHEDSVRIT